MKFKSCIFRGQKIQVLKILGHQNTYFLMKNLNFGQNFSYLIFEAVNVRGFRGPAQSGGDKKK